jgi:hypothetical protein
MSPRVAKPKAEPKRCRHQWGIWPDDTVPHDPMPIDGPMWEWCRLCHKVRKPKPAPEVQVQPLAERSLVEGQGAPKPDPRLGVHPKRTPEIRKALLQALEVGGISLAKAAQAAGINPDTLVEWKKDDPSLSDDIDAARGRAVLRNAANLATAARRDVRAMIWLAEHGDPEFGEKRIVIDIRQIAIKVLTKMGKPTDDATVEALMEQTGVLLTEGGVTDEPKS